MTSFIPALRVSWARFPLVLCVILLICTNSANEARADGKAPTLSFEELRAEEPLQKPVSFEAVRERWKKCCPAFNSKRGPIDFGRSRVTHHFVGDCARTGSALSRFLRP